MIRPLFRARRRQVLIDVDTQRDFFLAEGKACIRNHRRVLSNLRRVIAWARRRHILVISTCDIYPNNGNGGSAIDYCLEGTEGQKKIHYTLLNKRISFPADGSTDLPRDMLRRYRQVIMHKRCTDPFDEPRIDRLLTELHASEFLLVGANAEDAIQAMALGLLQRGKIVCIITDAIGCSDKKQAEMAFKKMKAKGAKLIEAKKLAGTTHLKSVGICHCQACSRKQSPKQVVKLST